MKKENIIERKKNLLRVFLSSVLFFNIAYYVPQIAFSKEIPIVAVEGLPEKIEPGDNPMTPQREVLLPEKVAPRYPAKTYENRHANPKNLKQEECRTVKGKMRCAPKIIQEK